MAGVVIHEAVLHKCGTSGVDAHTKAVDVVVLVVRDAATRDAAALGIDADANLSVGISGAVTDDAVLDGATPMVNTSTFMLTQKMAEEVEPRSTITSDGSPFMPMTLTRLVT